MDGGAAGVAEGPSGDSPGVGWNVTVGLSARDGDAFPISGTRQSSVTVSGRVSGTAAGAWSVVRNGSSGFGGGIGHHSLRGGSRSAAIPQDEDTLYRGLRTSP